MVKEAIKLKEALSIMRRLDKEGEPFPFSCQVRTFNRQSKKGGRLLSISQAILLPLSGGNSQTPASVESLKFISPAKRSPNHYENKTRNIKLPNGNVKKINLNFLISINSLQVTY